MKNYVCPECGEFLECKTIFFGEPELPYTKSEIFCNRCGIHLNGNAVPRDQTKDELERLYQELQNN